MAVDLSEFEALSKPQRMKCFVVAVLDELPDDAREKFVAALAAEAITHSAISQWLARQGVKVTSTTVSRHRRGQCSCD